MVAAAAAYCCYLVASMELSLVGDCEEARDAAREPPWNDSPPPETPDDAFLMVLPPRPPDINKSVT